jgi:hypothetical protein
MTGELDDLAAVAVMRNLSIISLDRGAVSLKALEIVQNFCNPLHGDAVQTVHHVFVHILPYLWCLIPVKKI